MGKDIAAILFDFGGVLAEEGFYRGLLAVGERHGMPPEKFFSAVETLIYETGYLTGRSDESSFWETVRNRTGISASDLDLRNEILGRFVIRPRMVAAVDRLRAKGLIVAVLSDQTNWLDEIDEATSLFLHFDRVFNSYHLHKSKRDASVFGDVCEELGVQQDKTLFIDDNIGHIERARSRGLETMHFVSEVECEERLNHMMQRAAGTANEL